MITFEHDVTVHLNGEDIRALHFPAGHTDGDAVIFFPKNNVVHMGDDFVRYGFPFIDVAERWERARDDCGDGKSVSAIAGGCESDSGTWGSFEPG